MTDNNSSDDTDPTREENGERLTITLEDTPLPDDEDERNRVLRIIRKAVKDKVYGQMASVPENVSTTVGKQYTQIDNECPLCGHLLSFHEVDLEPDGTVRMTANCTECSFSGDSVSRLVDLHGPTEDPEKNPNARDNWASLVKEDLVTPEQHSY